MGRRNSPQNYPSRIAAFTVKLAVKADIGDYHQFELDRRQSLRMTIGRCAANPAEICSDWILSTLKKLD